MGDKPYTIEKKKSLVDGSFAITSAEMASTFMNDMDDALVEVFPELGMGGIADDAGDHSEDPLVPLLPKDGE